jgi:transposase
MGTKTNPPYATAFRQQIVELYAAGRTPGELSAEFGCSKAAIHDWVKKAGALRDLPDGGRAVKQVHRQAQRVHAAAALSQEEREELLRLRKQVRQLQLERDILSKATAWFAHKSEKTLLGATN